mgnify:FL=1|tara:strand:- start:5348 stop:6388 length:1041 start_codon:yes stop_codon:yes gene_type:complete
MNKNMTMKKTKKWNDGTANFWEGCTKTSLGCELCKGAARDEKHREGKHWGEGAPRSQLKSGFMLAISHNQAAADERFREDLATGERKIWRRQDMGQMTDSVSKPVRPQLQIMDLGDFWDPETPTEIRMLALETIMSCTFVDFMITTKRPEEARNLLSAANRLAGDLCRDELVDWITDWLGQTPPKNVFLGVTVELQDHANRLEEMATGLSAVAYYVEMKPILGAITIPPVWQSLARLIVVEGSRGPESRPIHPEWLDQIWMEAALYRIPFHFASWGDWLPEAIEAPPIAMQKRDTLHYVGLDGAITAMTSTPSPLSAMTWRHMREDPQRLLPDGTTADARIQPANL